MINISSIKIIYAVFHGVIHHLLHLRFVNAAVFQKRQAHGAETQRGELLILKRMIDHSIAPYFSRRTKRILHTSSPRAMVAGRSSSQPKLSAMPRSPHMA